MHPLSPCTACGRHVRTSETACPFCHAEVTGTPAKRTKRPPRGLSRGALMAWGAAFSMAAACGGGEADLRGREAAVYGGPPADEYESAGGEEEMSADEQLPDDSEAEGDADPGVDPDAEARPEESPPVPVYGTPPAPD